MDRYQIERFDVQDADNKNFVILITGTQLYKQILQRAFHGYYFSRTFDDRYGRFDWGTYVYDVDESTYERIVEFLRLLHKSIYIHDDLTETFALDFHTQLAPHGYKRTQTGSLVYAAKPYNQTTGDRDKADELANALSDFIHCHPSYAEVDTVVAVPPSNIDKSFDLPTHLVDRIAARTGKEDATSWIRKVRDTKQMKNCETIQQKIDNVRNAYMASSDAIFEDKTVLLIDDIYQSGFTINEVGRTIRAAGAVSVFGLVATKTALDLQ
jgi:predicted amidophosphoribosyltransferase